VTEEAELWEKRGKDERIRRCDEEVPIPERSRRGGNWKKNTENMRQ